MGTTEIQEMPFKYRVKLFYSKDGETQEQVVCRDCEVSVLRDIQNLTVHGPEQPALAGPALTMWLD